MSFGSTNLASITWPPTTALQRTRSAAVAAELEDVKRPRVKTAQ